MKNRRKARNSKGGELICIEIDHRSGVTMGSCKRRVVNDDRLTIPCNANIEFHPIEWGAKQRRKRLIAVLFWSIARGAVQASMRKDEWPGGHTHGRRGSPARCAGKPRSARACSISSRAARFAAAIFAEIGRAHV